MKSLFKIKLCLILVLASLFGCGSGMKNAGSQTGSVTAQLKWIGKNVAKLSGKHLAKAPQGVITVRIVVSGADMSNVQLDFPADAGTAEIDGIPVGSDRTVTAQGLDGSGVVTHQGVVNNVTVTPGLVTDAGTVVMNPAGETFTVSGIISFKGSGLSGVTVSLQGTSFSTITGADGTYTFTDVPNATYTIVPSIAGYTFATATRSVPDTNGNVTGQDFVAAPIPAQTFTVSGNVTLNGNGLPGVTVSLQGTSFSAVTGPDGTYALTGVSNGSYTVIPALTGYTFAPSSLPVTISNGDVTGQNFTAAAIPAQTFTISGTVTLNGNGLPGVTVSLQGTSSNSVITGADGSYSFAGVQNGLYTVSPSLAGFVFSPANRSVGVNNSNMTGQDFTATVPTFTISGMVTLNGSGLSGVTVSLQGATSSSVTTGQDGTYSFTGAQNGSYTLTASLAGDTFAPSSLPVSVNNGNVTGQNFIASVATQPGIFAQADLTGIWDHISFAPGANNSSRSIWISESIAIDGQGNVTCISHQTSKGDTTCGSGGSGVVSIDSNGTINVFGGNFNGNMSLDKNLIVGTLTDNSAFGLDVLRKRAPGVTYSSADVANIPFALHALYGGSSNIWVYGTGSTDASGQITMTSLLNTPSGTINPPANAGMLQVDSNGNVTVPDDSSFHGIMTPDKKAIFAVDTKGGTEYHFFAFLVTGQTFTTADLAGAGNFHNIWDTGWNHGTFVIDTAGNQTYLSNFNSAGNAVIPTNDVVSITASGALTKSSNASYHGQLSFNKNMNVHTATDANGHNSIGITMSLPTGGITVEWKRRGH